MSTHPDIPKFMTMGPVLPVMVIPSLDQALPLADALMAGGIKVLEITLRTDCALDAIKLIAKERPDAVVGAGTVLTPKDAEKAAKAGAKFLVSPGLTKSLAQQDALPLLPGVATSSEVMKALEWGFTHLKFFPAVPAGGIPYLKGIGGPLPQAKFCPTGGIDVKNAADFLALDNVLCVGGSWVAPSRAMAEGNWAEITRLSAEAVAAFGKKV
ncbi:bifunctional 4-hydroxy-2-oxoglutarate aldolase/2-dehydro-3-deoxy-phosphogluconate aldolase [Asticcacaulis sp. EMRT-3]|uniref:bifunctional 4-hydroxy-2-oxoglutarate aldolase/2-dehydro-3-deoxy-phosphogluconate aldolase n=1 Tax=Asticcacaulis sp. EMRT-3 TaxID=3040349 RepID=UPI0024AEEEE3|nr:bifunctional 4-hydroxy-2-oxoglutarate aldolase/2-dehydro-3-deoxy-phosphogluconate aldolase [Asticcacaulis sp. EMRT-3]MDI7775350.1 bifunctional 4-hydroxy-2-oxoglutarate aldolase/2-dehydro-3-deoxy-phosphogluconate aldolase [Asticcacaulis sp. EMRT-3]